MGGKPRICPRKIRSLRIRKNEEKNLKKVGKIIENVVIKLRKKKMKKF